MAFYSLYQIWSLFGQFARSVERPAAEGEEASSKVMNGHTSTTQQEAVNSQAKAIELAWQEKIQALTAQQDKM